MTLADERGRKHWNSVAECWHLYTSPLRPCAEDLAAYLRLIYAHTPAPVGRSSAALILGVTPEIATMSWPAGMTVTGADRSREMIELVWPGDREGHRRAVCADWFGLPEPPEPYDLVLADGSFNTIGYPDDLLRLVERLRAIVRPGALLVSRTFVRPPERESVAGLAEIAKSGAAGGFHAFKFRLAMALQPNPEEGVGLDQIWRQWQWLDGEIDTLLEVNGWQPDVVGTIELFRDKQVRLSFPSREELADTLQAAGLTLLDGHTPTYEMGERCAISAWRF